jgi:hypothetical protein
LADRGAAASQEINYDTESYDFVRGGDGGELEETAKSSKERRRARRDGSELKETIESSKIR